MSNELVIALVLGLALLPLGYWLHLRASRQRRHRRREQETETLEYCLELLQAVQKHRGLGALRDMLSTSKRGAIARQLDQLWQAWPAPGTAFPPLHQQWPLLRRNPADFDAHCQLIEALLSVIEQLEDRLYRQQRATVRGVAQACRALEDLARLRGLSVRAADYERCPSGLQMQMRFLCQRLLAQDDDEDLYALIEHLHHELIDATEVSLTPTECFALLTPLIDQRLQAIRLRLR